MIIPNLNYEELLRNLVHSEKLDIYLILSGPSSLSTATLRAIGASPSMDAVFHEPFASFSLLQNDPCKIEDAWNISLWQIYTAVTEKLKYKDKTSMAIKTMANDISSEHYCRLLELSKGALTLIRNPQSQIVSFSRKADEGLDERLSDSRELKEKLSQLFAEHAFMAYALFDNNDADHLCWQSMYDHLVEANRREVKTPHLTLQAELLFSPENRQQAVENLCDIWDIKFSDYMIAEEPEDGSDAWLKTAGDRLYDGYIQDENGRTNDNHARDTFNARGWRSRKIEVPSISTMPEAARNFINETAFPLYMSFLRREDMYGPSNPSRMQVIYGEGFKEVAQAIIAKGILAMDELPTLRDCMLKCFPHFSDPKNLEREFRFS